MIGDIARHQQHHPAGLGWQRHTGEFGAERRPVRPGQPDLATRQTPARAERGDNALSNGCCGIGAQQPGYRPRQDEVSGLGTEHGDTTGVDVVGQPVAADQNQFRRRGDDHPVAFLAFANPAILS
jgi:hypothetical protein